MAEVRIIAGDCRDVLRTLPDESVHCVVTSPPYWGLRDYGVEGQLGLEPTYPAYIERMVAVFREVLRQPCRDPKHRCGVMAAVFLNEMVKGSLVACRATGTQSWGRMVGICRMNGQDLGELMVRNGLAYDWPRYSGGRYAAAMPRAELMFERPWEWRAKQRDGGSR